MATWDDVRRLALALPLTSERVSRGSIQWRVGEKLFVWERPLGKADLKALGELAPDGPILGVHVVDEEEKGALIAQDPEVYFTIPHFDGYPAVLVRLDQISVEELGEIVTDAWLSRAPKKAAQEFLDG